LALYNNPNLFYQEKRVACIGNYECVNDDAVANTLLGFIIQETKKSGVDFLIGPMNGSTWDNYRFSAHHNHANFLLEPFHHLYYIKHFENVGFKPVSAYISSINREIQCDHPEVLKKDIDFEGMGVTIRQINLAEYEEELKRLYPFLMNAFKSNFLYTQISWETFRIKYREAINIINPEYVLIAEDNSKNIIGFIFCYDDLFNNAEKSLVIKTIAREPSKQWSGLGHVIANRVIRIVKNKGYKSLVHAFMIEEGTSTDISKNFFGTIYKNYNLYGIKL
jgi:hypothetical protein